MWGLHPDVGGVGYMVPLYAYRMMNAALVRGGTHGLASALYAHVRAGNVDILEWAEVDRIITENGTATGVGLTDGREFHGRAVVSTLNPDQTFLKCIGKDRLPAGMADTLENWEWDVWSLLTSHLGIKGEPPHYRAADFNPDDEPPERGGGRAVARSGGGWPLHQPPRLPPGQPRSLRPAAHPALGEPRAL